MDVRAGPEGRQSAEELMLLNCGAGEDYWEIKPVNPLGNRPWIVTGRTDVEAEAPILWPPDAKSQLIGKDLDSGKDWRQKRATENETVGWHHWFMAWTWGNSGRWWGTGKTGMLQSMGSQRVRRNLVIEQQILGRSRGFPGGTSGKEVKWSCSVVSNSLWSHGL